MRDGNAVVDRVGCDFGRVEHDVADEGAVEDVLQAEVFVALRCDGWWRRQKTFTSSEFSVGATTYRAVANRLFAASIIASSGSLSSGRYRH